MCMSVDKEAIRKETGRAKYHIQFWGSTHPPRYHTERSHNYRKFPNKKDPEVLERAKWSVQ